MTKESDREIYLREESERLWQDVRSTFKSPNDAMIFIQTLTAHVIIDSHKNKKDALSTAYRLARNVERGIKELWPK